MTFTARAAIALSILVIVVQLIALGFEEYLLQNERSTAVQQQLDTTRMSEGREWASYVAHSRSSLATIGYHEAHANYFISVLFDDEDGRVEAEGRLDNFYRNIQKESDFWRNISLWSSEKTFFLAMSDSQRKYDDIPELVIPEQEQPQTFSKVIFSETEELFLRVVVPMFNDGQHDGWIVGDHMLDAYIARRIESLSGQGVLAELIKGGAQYSDAQQSAVVRLWDDFGFRLIGGPWSF